MRKNTSTPRTAKWRNNNRAEYNRYLREYRSRTIDDMLDDPHEVLFEPDPRKRKAVNTATPPWIDADEIRSVYEKCAALNRKYPGTTFVVHHDIPIRHVKVCGLHVVANLRIVSLAMKKKLGRKFTG